MGKIWSTPPIFRSSPSATETVIIPTVNEPHKQVTIYDASKENKQLQAQQQQKQQHQHSTQMTNVICSSDITDVPITPAMMIQRQLNAASVSLKNVLQRPPIPVIQSVIQHIPGFGRVQLVSPSSLTTLTEDQTISVSPLNLALPEPQQSTSLHGDKLQDGTQTISADLIRTAEAEAPNLLAKAEQVSQSPIISVEDRTSSASVEDKKTRRNLACTCQKCRERGRSSDSSKIRIQVCHYPGCNQQLKKNQHFKAHLRRHEGKRPYECDWDLCKKKFTRHDELQRHKKIHTGIKLYICTKCDKKFARSDYLSKHMKTHTKKLSLVTNSSSQYSDISSSDNEERF